MPWVTPTTLQNEHALLRPLLLDDASSLAEAAESPDTFRHFSRTPRSVSTEGMREFIDFLIRQPNTVPFCVVNPPTGSPVGITTYLDIRDTHRTLEIGWTWYAPSLRGTLLNPACKLLLLEHAFEKLDAIRVQLKTDQRNARSRAAILKLGATFEGNLRHLVIMPDGYLRTTSMYSIIASEWPGVCARLKQRLLGPPPLAERIDAPSGEAGEGAPVFVTIEADRYRTTIDARGHTIHADEPTSLGGRDTAPTPAALLLAAVGACKAITCRMYADRKQYPLQSVHLRLTHDRRSPGDETIHAAIDFVGDLTDEQRRRLLDIAGRCPVERTITGQLEIHNELASS